MSLASEIPEDLKQVLNALKDPQVLAQLNNRGKEDCCCPTIILYLIRADRVVVAGDENAAVPPRGAMPNLPAVRSWVMTPSGRREITK